MLLRQAAKVRTGYYFRTYFIIPLITLVIAFVAFSFFTNTYIFAEEQRSGTTNFTYSLDEIIINLKDESRYLKVELALGYNLRGDEKSISEKEVQIRDTLLEIFRSKSVKDILPIENSKSLKNEIQDKVNRLFSEKIVTDIYITDFLVQ
jgi:flagellar FliL protein